MVLRLKLLLSNLTGYVPVFVIELVYSVFFTNLFYLVIMILYKILIRFISCPKTSFQTIKFL